MVVFLFSLCTFAQKEKPQRINIWQGTAVGKTVMMTPYLAKGKGNVAVIVCPGGSYLWHDMGAEGKDVGKWLQRNGISAFVLHYRTAGVGAFMTPYRYVFRGNRYPDALNDLQRAMQYVKAHAEEMGIDASHVAAMGFSAGAHGSSFPSIPSSQWLNLVSISVPVVPCWATVGCAISSCVIHYPWSVMCRRTVHRCS